MTSQVSIHQPPTTIFRTWQMCTFFTRKLFHSNVVEDALPVFVDSAPVRVRHASAHDDADPDSGNTISQSVAMAIAGSPLPHAKANPFALPAVVSDDSRGRSVPPGTRERQVTDLTPRGRLWPQFDTTPLWSFCSH